MSSNSKVLKNFDFWIDDDLNDKMPASNKICIPSLEVKNFSYKFDYDEYSSKDKTQNEFDFGTNSLNYHKINLCESFIDPELMYFEKDLPEILSLSPKRELISEPLICMHDYLPCKLSYFGKINLNDSHFRSTQKEDSTTCVSSYQILHQRNINSSPLNIISEDLNVIVDEILQVNHSDTKLSSPKNNDDRVNIQKLTFSDPDSEDSLNFIIIKNFLKNIEKQHKIENDEEVVRKIGRPSNYKCMKSSDIKSWLITIFQNKLINLLCNKTKEVRIDLFTTEYFRMVRKIPHYFTQDFCTQIYFKNPDISKSIVGLVEAFSAYSFAQNNFEVSNIIERVVDFSVVYFSEDKCLKLINELMATSDPRLRRILKDKLRILELRRKSSTKYMKEFACNSSTMRELFKISLQVLSQFLEHKSNCKESASISKISQNCNISGRRVTTRKSALVNTNSTHNSSSKLEILSSAQKKRAEYLYQKTKRVLNL